MDRDIVKQLHYQHHQGFFMVIEREPQLSYSSVEEVITTWENRLGKEWVNEVLATPNLEQKINDFAARTGRTVPAAWSSYFSSIMLSQL